MTYERKVITIAITLILLFSVMASSAMTVSLFESAPSQYAQFIGTIEAIEYYEPDRLDLPKVTLVDESGQIVVFTVTEYTYLPENTKLAVGDRMVGVYDLNVPVIMIYPPQYQALVLAPAAGIQGVKVERFDENLLSADGELKLLPGDYPVFFRNGIAYEGELTGCLLAVFHSFVMTSFPAQTTPDYIVVLAGLENDPNIVLLEHRIFVNGEPINAPQPYINDQGVVMTPIKAIAEALGHTYNWDETAQAVILDKGITLTFGSTEYYYMRMAPIDLGVAPEMLHGIVYAPLSFYTEVLRLNNAYLFEGQVVIDDGEKME